MFVFKHGAHHPDDVLIDHPYKEVAFVGRSNVGKSSLINTFTGQKNLARTSKTPGRTQQINYFLNMKDKLYLVDLPGYGFSMADKKMKKAWEYLMNAYFQNNHNLMTVFILIDARRGLLDIDEQMIAYVQNFGHFYQLVYTKCDKRDATQLLIKNAICTSSITKAGMEELRNVVIPE